jgi:hypothetical protein
MSVTIIAEHVSFLGIIELVESFIANITSSLVPLVSLPNRTQPIYKTITYQPSDIGESKHWQRERIMA